MYKNRFIRQELLQNATFDIGCFPLEYEEGKENSFPGYTGSAPSENTCENKPDISKDEIKVKWFI